MAKIRTDFVTNSSSSSFVIAINSNATEQDVRNIIEGHREEISAEVNRAHWLQDDVDTIIDDIVSFIWSDSKYGMKLENWIVYGGEMGNEGDDWQYIMYDMISIDTDLLKVRWFC